MLSVELRVALPRPGLLDAPASMQETASALTSNTSDESCQGGGGAIDGRSRFLVGLLRVRVALAGLGVVLAANGAQAADECFSRNLNIEAKNRISVISLPRPGKESRLTNLPLKMRSGRRLHATIEIELVRAITGIEHSIDFLLNLDDLLQYLSSC